MDAALMLVRATNTGYPGGDTLPLASASHTLPHGGTFYASPVVAAGKLLLVDTEGNITVIAADAEWTVLSTTQLDEGCYATPAIASGCVYLRGESHLFCFGNAS